mmetsp:Transcript_50792/g.147980  ORF Transcript_50792/g.147980 Transcript_50792/m.147980 type:complete len:205 (+) Transcript_50792:89-703(+)
MFMCCVPSCSSLEAKPDDMASNIFTWPYDEVDFVRATFTVPLVRESARVPWGLEFDTPASGNIYIRAIEGGSVAHDYNEVASEDQRILPHDCIVSVDGQMDMPVMLGSLLNRTSVVLELKRPQIFDQIVPKSRRGKPLGMTLEMSRVTLSVTGIEEDSSVRSSRADVAVGDLIVAVNGRCGEAPELLSDVKTCEAPVLTIVRVC